jgi:hypothetical protein
VVIIIGHHGTNRQNAANILQEGFRSSVGEEQWFGEGVYFFEDDPIEAKNWAVKVRGFVRGWAVLRGTIHAETVLDITKARFWEKFISIREQIRKTNREKGFKEKTINDAVAVNLMCNCFAEETGVPVDVVKAGLNVPNYTWVNQISNIPRMQFQICVRNTDCIRDIAEEAV